MRVRKICASLLVGLVVLALAACGSRPSSTLPARSLSVELTEFTITPGDYAAQVGEPLTFVVTNAGVLDHDLTIVDADGEQVAHVPVKSGQTASFEFQPATAAEFQLLCSINGHAKAGMSAPMIVEP
jgi:uncharacterized cupredoxin-like copper-binding protein